MNDRDCWSKTMRWKRRNKSVWPIAKLGREEESGKRREERKWIANIWSILPYAFASSFHDVPQEGRYP